MLLRSFDECNNYRPQSNFFAALDQPSAAERSRYLDAACGGDSQLRSRVDQLLAAHEQAGQFLGGTGATVATTNRTSEGEASPLPESEMPLDFLLPSQQPGRLGRLGHYEVVEVVGRGGMGIVLRAFDEKLQRVVAIKVMAAQLATCTAARQRFIREAQAAAAVSHDHVVTIHAVEEANGLPYLAMQFVSGISLQERLDKSGPLELREIVRIGMEMAAGLAAAHAQGLIHRDIKPANILLENGVERVKITDFGLARAVTDASVTQTGMVAGTPQYMSPEQARGDTVDRRSDLFSLGSVLYAMCTGRPPFRGDSGIAVLKRVCDDTPRPIPETNPEIPEWLEAIIARLHAKDPAERYQSAAEVADLLNEHLAHLQHPSVVPLPAAVQSPSPAGRGARGEGTFRGGRRLWAIAAAVLLCLTLGLGLTEATGTTQLTATVIRIFTPGGTLIVEVDDPQVQVTIEGDGGLSITGAGAQEVRVRPGKYHVEASKDGKPVATKLVEITRGDRKVVTVTREPLAPSLANVPALLSPAPDEVLPNGTFLPNGGADKTAKYVWEFSWTTVPGAERYQVHVIAGDNKNSTTLLETESTNYRLTKQGNYYKSSLILSWKVRAKISGEWAPWSEPRPFRVAVPAASAFAAQKVDSAKGEFVVLKNGEKTAEYGAYDTLAEAVIGARDGDTIEIRGNGPFVTGPIVVSDKALVIRAGLGTRPVFKPSPAALDANELFFARAPLVLEGIEVHWMIAGQPQRKYYRAIVSSTASLSVAHCRMIVTGRTNTIYVNSKHCELRNCELFLDHAVNEVVGWRPRKNSRLIVDGCIIAGVGVSLELGMGDAPVEASSVQFTSNTIIGGTAMGLYRFTEVPDGNRQLSLRSTDNVIGSRRYMVLVNHEPVPQQAEAAAQMFAKSLLSYEEQRNLYDTGSNLLAYGQRTGGLKWLPLIQPESDIASWHRFWGLEGTSSQCGTVRFQGGQLEERAIQDLYSVTPTDFRLADGSPGKGAGNDGKDLGADVDLVGPGPAYERWKTTPKYQEWLKDTGQRKELGNSNAAKSDT